MTYSLGAKSLANLVGVHPVIVETVKAAIVISTQDFSVNEGCRTLERQKKLVAAGASHTLDSMHIPKLDLLTGTGKTFGHAVDLVPFIDGTLRWEWGPIYQIAAAIYAAALQLGHAKQLVWGGVWGLAMSAYGGDADAMKRAVNTYVDARRKVGKTAFIDGPHFQVGRMT